MGATTMTPDVFGGISGQRLTVETVLRFVWNSRKQEMEGGSQPKCHELPMEPVRVFSPFRLPPKELPY